MANEKEIFGMPKVLITFKNKIYNSNCPFCPRHCGHDFEKRNNGRYEIL